MFPIGGLEIASSGEAKKVYMQREALTAYGVECEIQYVHNKHAGILGKILRRVPLYGNYRKEDIKNTYLQINCSVEYIYIRRGNMDRSFLSLIIEMRKRNPNVKMLFEIPTFPYDNELSRICDFPILLKDRWYRGKLKKYIDRFVVLSNDEMVFGVPCIKIDNGIDCAEIHARKADMEKGEIRLLGVAGVASWHGYDRVIRGLGEYYKLEPNKKVEFHIVGDGTVVKELKKLCCDLRVEQYVFFHGWMHGKELDDMFDRCDIGVGSLGMYRIGLENGNTLKLREYTARGIPFFYGYADKLIKSCVDDYTMQVPNDDSPIDIATVISFYEKMKEKGFDKIAVEMRKLAEEHLSWAKQMKPVVDYILSDEK